MNREWAFILLPITGFAAPINLSRFPLPAHPSHGSRNSHRKAKGKRENPSLTGSVDEQDDYYVPVDERRTLTPIANMEGHGFPMEKIARHVGLKVTVRGISGSGTRRPVSRYVALTLSARTTRHRNSS